MRTNNRCFLSFASSLDSVSRLCLSPPFQIQADGTKRLLCLLSLCVIISTPCFLQLVLDVVFIQLFVVADHKFFGKVLEERQRERGKPKRSDLPGNQDVVHCVNEGRLFPPELSLAQDISSCVSSSCPYSS